LIDSGANNNFIDPELAKQWRLPLKPLSKTTKIRNADGSTNNAKNYVDIEFTTDRQNQTIKATVTKLGQPRLILGTPWLQNANPEINWKNKTISLDR
ncbi:hypothetical protein AN958_11157, partial [Leucoagaricus sp. SymC.cos]